mgnify:FL=1
MRQPTHFLMISAARNLHQSKPEKVAAHGRLPPESCRVARAFEHEIVRVGTLHKTEAERAVYHVVDYDSEKVEFKNFVEHEFAADDFHNLRAAVLLAVRLRRHLYFKLHTLLLFATILLPQFTFILFYHH